MHVVVSCFLQVFKKLKYDECECRPVPNEMRRRQYAFFLLSMAKVKLEGKLERTSSKQVSCKLCSFSLEKGAEEV